MTDGQMPPTEPSPPVLHPQLQLLEAGGAVPADPPPPNQPVSVEGWQEPPSGLCPEAVFGGSPSQLLPSAWGAFAMWSGGFMGPDPPCNPAFSGSEAQASEFRGCRPGLAVYTADGLDSGYTYVCRALWIVKMGEG